MWMACWLCRRRRKKKSSVGAIEKARGEKLVQQAIEQGMSASEAFRKFGIM